MQGVHSLRGRPGNQPLSKKVFGDNDGIGLEDLRGEIAFKRIAIQFLYVAFLVNLGMCLLAFYSIMNQIHLVFWVLNGFPLIFADFERTKMPLRNYYVKGAIFT
jgi:hypothetical protein